MDKAILYFKGSPFWSSLDTYKEYESAIVAWDWFVFAIFDGALVGAYYWLRLADHWNCIVILFFHDSFRDYLSLFVDKFVHNVGVFF